MCNSDSENAKFAAGLLLGVTLMSFVLLVVVNSITAVWRREAVERGVAEYSTATGAWQWKGGDADK